MLKYLGLLLRSFFSIVHSFQEHNLPDSCSYETISVHFSKDLSYSFQAVTAREYNNIIKMAHTISFEKPNHSVMEIGGR